MFRPAAPVTWTPRWSEEWSTYRRPVMVEVSLKPLCGLPLLPPLLTSHLLLVTLYPTPSLAHIGYSWEQVLLGPNPLPVVLGLMSDSQLLSPQHFGLKKPFQVLIMVLFLPYKWFFSLSHSLICQQPKLSLDTAPTSLWLGAHHILSYLRINLRRQVGIL